MYRGSAQKAPKNVTTKKANKSGKLIRACFYGKEELNCNFGVVNLIEIRLNLEASSVVPSQSAVNRVV